MIRYLTPWTTDKNLSGYYNREIMALENDNDWVCLTDRDTWFPHPFYGKQIEEVIKEHGEQYSLFTCYTNRVGTDYQCIGEDQNDMKYHEFLATKLSNLGTEVIDITNRSPISGMLILVKKSLLSKNRLLPDGLLLGADNQIHYLAQEVGEKVGLMKGVYVWHYYRGNTGDKSHLL